MPTHITNGKTTKRTRETARRLEKGICGPRNHRGRPTEPVPKYGRRYGVPFHTKVHRNNCIMSDLRRRLISWHAGCIDCWHQPNIMNNKSESTYALLVRSEEKSRGVLEIAVYAAFILSVVFSILQFAQMPATVAAPGTKPCVACHATTSEFRAGT